MLKSLLLVGLTSSLLAVGQSSSSGVNNNSGYVTSTTGTPLQVTPLLAPPNVALPGSGPATGAPPALGVNDSRNGGEGSVYQPGGGTLRGGGLEIELGPTTSNPTVGNYKGTEASSNPRMTMAQTGLGTFVEPSAVSDVSLADLARQYKSQNAKVQVRKFDNSNVRAALPQSDQSSMQENQSATDPAVTQSAANTVVMDQHDLAAVQAALAHNASAPDVNTNAAMAMTDPNTNTLGNQAQNDDASSNTLAQVTVPNDGTTPQVEGTTSANAPNAALSNRLPASSSPLPLLALMGIIACSAGGLCVYKFSHNKARA